MPPKKTPKKPRNFLEELAQLKNAAPDDFDPENDADEDVRPFGDDDEAEFGESAPEHRPSRLRQAIVDDDPKYAGRRVSRKQLEQEGSDRSDGEEEIGIYEERDSASDDDDDVIFRYVAGLEGIEDESEDESSGADGTARDDQPMSDDDMSEEEEDDDQGEDVSHFVRQYQQLEQDEEKVAVTSAVDFDSERLKGQHARNQLMIWEALMEIRIHLQKALVACNELPRPDRALSMYSQEDISGQVDSTRESVRKLTATLSSLQDAALSQNAVTKSCAVEGGKRKRSLDDIDATEDILSEQHTLLGPFFKKTAEKWHTKTRLASGKPDKAFKALNRSIMEQVEQVMSDKDRLLTRTRTPRADYHVVGNDSTLQNGSDGELSADDDAQVDKAVDKELFDDTDFYHDLLRELIDQKVQVHEGADPIAMGKNWVEMNRYRTKVKRRKVDTKASKGRKVRYNVLEKIVNFMPRIDGFFTATERAKDDLFASLFGKKPGQAQ